MDERIKNDVEDVGDWLVDNAPEDIYNKYNNICNGIIELWMEKNSLLSYYKRKRKK